MAAKEPSNTLLTIRWSKFLNLQTSLEQRLNLSPISFIVPDVAAYIICWL